MYGTIGFGFRRICFWDVAEIVESSTSTACVGQYEICCIGNNAENHVAGIVANDHIWICGKIIQK
jgi:hypothetical protein